MKVSAIIPVWNGARFLGAALASVRAQRRPADEVVVVDDGSTDASAAVARAAGARVVAQPHQGVGAARNRGLDEAGGDLIAWLDADDEWTPDKLAVQVEHMLAHPEVGFTITHQRFRLEPGARIPDWVPGGDVGAEPPCAGTASLVAWSWAFARVGRFDTTKLTAEDLDWMIRAAEAGVAMALLPRTLLVRRIHDDNLTTRRRPGRADLLASLRSSIRKRKS